MAVSNFTEFTMTITLGEVGMQVQLAIPHREVYEEHGAGDRNRTRNYDCLQHSGHTIRRHQHIYINQ